MIKCSALIGVDELCPRPAKEILNKIPLCKEHADTFKSVGFVLTNKKGLKEAKTRGKKNRNLRGDSALSN